MVYQKLNEFKLPKDFRGKNKFIVQIWAIFNSLLFSNSPQFMFQFRVFLLRLFGAKIGKNVLIRSSVVITYPWKLEIGDNTWIGEGCYLYNLAQITIGSNVSIAHRNFFNTGGHDYNKTTFDIFAKPIIIEDQCWITSEVYISPGVTIGKGTVVGVRSLVFNDLPTGMVCYGNPAKPIKEREIVK
jgi:putative colanic acid biosynthesis acetyltransferase WcaF